MNINNFKNCKTPLNKMSFSLHNQFQLGLSNDPSYLYTAARASATGQTDPDAPNFPSQNLVPNGARANLTKITNPSRKLSLIQGVGVMHSPFVSSSASLFAGAARNADDFSDVFGITTADAVTSITTVFGNTGINDSVVYGVDGGDFSGYPLPVYNSSTGEQDTSLPDYGSTYYNFNTPCKLLSAELDQPSLPEQVIEGATPPSDCPGQVNFSSLQAASLVSPVENEIFYNSDADGIISGDLKVTEFPKVFNSPTVGNYPTSTASLPTPDDYEKRNAAGVILNYPAGNATIAIQLNVITSPVDPTQAADVEWIVLIAVSNTAAAPLGVNTTLTISSADITALFPGVGGVFIGDLVIVLTEDNFANGTPFTDRDPKNLGKLKNVSVLQPKIMNAAGQKAYTQQISRTNENIFQLPGDFEPRVVLPSN
jgi:hypothetical protein